MNVLHCIGNNFTHLGNFIKGHLLKTKCAPCGIGHRRSYHSTTTEGTQAAANSKFARFSKDYCYYLANKTDYLTLFLRASFAYTEEITRGVCYQAIF